MGDVVKEIDDLRKRVRGLEAGLDFCRDTASNLSTMVQDCRHNEDRLQKRVAKLETDNVIHKAQLANMTRWCKELQAKSKKRKKESRKALELANMLATEILRGRVQ